MVLPLLALSLVTSALKSRHTDSVSLSVSLSVTRLDLHLDGHIKTVLTSKLGLDDTLSCWMLGTTAHLALVERVARVLGDLEVGVVTGVGHSVGKAIGAVDVAIRVLLKVGVRLGNDRVVTTRHSGVIGRSSLGLHTLDSLTGVLVEHLQQSLISVVVKVVNLVALCKQVRHGLWWRLVGDGRADDVGHVSPILLRWDLEARVGVESSER